MINLSKYITEKFKITKSTKGVIFEKGDPMVRFSFFLFASSGKVKFDIGGNECEYYRFGNIENNRIYFKSHSSGLTDLGFRNYYDYEQEIFINDKNFYEVSGKTVSNSKLIAIYLDKQSSIELIEKLISIYPNYIIKSEFIKKEDCNKINKILKDYFDSSTELPKEFIPGDNSIKSKIEELKKELEKL